MFGSILSTRYLPLHSVPVKRRSLMTGATDVVRSGRGVVARFESMAVVLISLLSVSESEFSGVGIADTMVVKTPMRRARMARMARSGMLKVGRILIAVVVVVSISDTCLVDQSY